MRSQLRPDRRFLFAAAVGLSTLALGACGDDPFEIQWASDIDTVTLYSLARPEIGLASAYDFNGRRSIVVEEPGATGSWDVAFEDDGSSAWFTPPGALGVESEAALAPIAGVAFEDVTEAPSDTSLYVGSQAVPISVGQTYVVRSRELRGFFGRLCVYYAKVEPVAVDFDARTVDFRFEASPACNDRSLVPTEDG